MTDSDAREDPDTMPERDREQRIEAIKRWVAYIQSEPPETWGPQQNTVVNAQLNAAQGAATSASHRKHVDAVAGEILDDATSDQPK